MLRRTGRRAQARRVLTEALQVFEQTGTLAWAERAESELRRLRGKRSVPGQLTPTETLVANLAISGLYNREIAERAFLSLKTVEANLTRVYRKLGIRSRGGLARTLETIKRADR
jgi:DNA-binding CsgD family transcriptional regulator